MSDLILTDAAVEIDDEPFLIEGNTVTFVEGQGEATVKAASRGGRVVSVTSEDITTKIGMIKFDAPATIATLNLSRDIKARGTSRVIRISGTDPSGERLGRTLTGAILTNDPEKQIQNEGVISLEFSGNPLIIS